MESGLRSVHTTNFPAILQELGISLLVSTYQAGKLIVVRPDGDKLNTHFRIYQKPMGIAVDPPGKIAIGTAHQIWELRNIPAVASRLSPNHDACFLPRQSHITGDIDIHEMAYGREGLWFLNTRFSCLCSLDADFSFVPRWRPPFVSGYDLSDRCHLNGLALVDGIPTYVTMLGETDSPGGWRANKANGGLLMDITSNQILLRGLSMPHSPRWYNNTLWVLESGQGTLAVVDAQQGRWQPIAQVPGFTRGIDFYGSLAFIGLSKIRETAVFSGLPITQRLTERICGVWVVDLRTGQTVAFLRFEEGVEEIFAVQVLPGIRFPEVLGDPRFADPEQDQLLGTSYVLPDDALRQVVKAEPPSVFQVEGDPEPVVQSFAVVVPVYNAADKGSLPGWEILERTLASIEQSVTHCQAHYAHADRIRHEIVIVDDASTDGTWEWLHTWAEGKAGVRLVRHEHNQGQGIARNTGVAATPAQAIFFCDDDDLFLEPHILTGVQLLNRPLDPNLANPIFRLPKCYPAAVKTGVRLADTLHPHWAEQIRQVLTLNLCIRREAHEFIEGFPGDPPFRLSVYGAEDQAYAQWLTHFFSVIWIPAETVAYLRYPGNHFDRQLRRFQSAPGSYQEAIDAEQQSYLEQIQALTQARLQHLQQKFEQEYNTDRLLALGNAAHSQGQRQQAAEYFRRCLERDPDLHLARYNLGVTCGDLELWAEAEYHLHLAQERDPQNPRIYNSLGFTCGNQNRLTEAVQFYEQALHWDPAFADAHMNLGMTLLKMGDLARGWSEFEWRWKTSQFTPFHCPHPQWQGEPIADKTLLVHTEQGAGDSIQFCRFLPLAAARCQKLIVVAPEHLIRLLRGIPGVSKIYPGGDIPLAEFQVYSPLMSLPRCLGIDDLALIPADVPYLTAPPIPESLMIKRQQTKGFGGSKHLHIGICWAGSPTQGNDHNRSSHLTEWISLLTTLGIHVHSLQKGPTVSQLDDLPPYIPLTNWDPHLHDYADTAALIQQLDLVITVDTSVAHVAGALGKPTWVLLCHNCDWRWLLEREDSPYYPTLRLFRQPQAKDWATVMQRVKRALQELV
ncbi:MAG: hypothetical protein OHK0012_22640 [Synechococcales cyanobacterium]